MNLAVLVLLGTMSAALLDYLFKSSAAAAFGKGPALTRYFALFYTANQVLSFAVQTFLTPVALRRLGLGRTVGWHPAAVAFGAGASLLGPQAIMAPLARGLELVLRGSFLRSGYELFFTPVPPREKRAVKTFIDVGCDRMGDAFGAGVLQLLLLLGPQQAVTPILLVAIGFAVISIWITTRMDAAYVDVLEHGLLSRAVADQRSGRRGLDYAFRPACERSTCRGNRSGAALAARYAPASRRAGGRPSTMPCWRGWPTCGRASPAGWRPRCVRICPSIRCWSRRPSGCWRGTRSSSGRAHFCCCMRIAPSVNWWTRCSIRNRTLPCAAGSRAFSPIPVRSAPWTG